MHLQMTFLNKIACRIKRIQCNQAIIDITSSLDPIALRRFFSEGLLTYYHLFLTILVLLINSCIIYVFFQAYGYYLDKN